MVPKINSFDLSINMGHPVYLCLRISQQILLNKTLFIFGEVLQTIEFLGNPVGQPVFTAKHLKMKLSLLINEYHNGSENLSKIPIKEERLRQKDDGRALATDRT